MIRVFELNHINPARQHVIAKYYAEFINLARQYVIANTMVNL